MNATPQSAASFVPGPALDIETAWSQVLRRDPEANFFYAVTTTGVFCRPSCSSRRPLRANVRFFATVDAARAAGFRPCLRCRPGRPANDGPLDMIRGHIEANLDRAVPLAELGRIAAMSPFTVQRLFKQAMGVSPLQYGRALRAGRMRSSLKQGASVTNAIYDAGFGSSSRAYEHAPLGMTPSRFATGGKGEHIRWASAPTPFGMVIVGATERGLCWLSLAESESAAQAALQADFPEARFHADSSLAAHIEAAIDQVVGPGARPDAPQLRKLAPPPVDLRGTVFQLRVWQALRAIPRGETRSYSQLAAELGNPNAIRAVARACSANRVALLVPCHRVIGVGGSLTGYRWGVDRKRQLLDAERIPATGAR